jgi:2-polyprenyl-3-methyl-5-hydroxy-6-metoxy-1,4-benzoquinol methylase
VTARAVRACPAGCGRSGRSLGELPVTSGAVLSRDRYSLVQCDCGAMLYLSPAPTASDLATMYIDEKQFGGEYTDPERVEAILGYVGSALDSLVRRIERDPRTPLRVLEVGAGMAWMCRAAKARHADALTVAQDVSPEAARSCDWVDHYIEGDVDDPRIAQHAPFDVISMTHVIEHLVDPVHVIARCRELLAPDGLMFVTAPHRPSGWSDAAPKLDAWRTWSYNHVPAHVQYFSERSLRRLARAAGCTLVHWSHAHDNGQAFEAWLGRQAAIDRSTAQRALLAVRRRANRLARLVRRWFGDEPMQA